MLGYILLFLAIVIAYNIKDKKKQLLFLFVVLTFFSGLRYGIGYDYYSYLASCMRGSYLADRYELLPRMIALWSQKTTPYLFFVLTSVFISFFYYLGIKKGGEDYFCETIFYICFPFLFFNQLSIIRQAMASAVVFYAMTLPHDMSLLSLKQYKRILLIVLAFLCHQSALVGVLILLPWHKVGKYFLWLMFISTFVAGVALVSIFEGLLYSGIFGEELSVQALRYIEAEASGEGKILRYLIYFVAVMSLALYNRLIKKDNTNAYYIGLVVLGASLFALFVFNSTVAKRFCIFFFSAAIFIVPRIVRVLGVPQLIYVSIMTILLSIQIYIGSSNTRPEDRNGSSVSYPYRTFLDRLE